MTTDASNPTNPIDYHTPVIDQTARPFPSNAAFQAERLTKTSQRILSGSLRGMPPPLRLPEITMLREATSLALPLDQNTNLALKQEDIELFYDSIADEFDRIMNRYDLQRRLETVFDVMLGSYNLTGVNLLDAGCGTGWFSLWASRRGAKVTAIDIGPRLLAQVRRKCDAQTELGDILNLQFEDNCFDVVVSSECIEHTRNPRQAIHELIRVCRPGGLTVITSNNRTWWWLCNLANKLHLRPYEGIENWPSWRQLRRWVEEEKAEVLDMRGIHLFPFQVSFLHPVLKFLDRFGRLIGPLCVNQAVLATKPC